MAKGRKTGGKDFSQGVSGNPAGRPPLPPDVREARKVNQVEFERVMNRLLYLTHSELDAVIQSPETVALEAMLAKMLACAATFGDRQRIETILNRTIGKVVTKVEVTAGQGERRPDEMTDQEIEAKIQELSAALAQKAG